MLSSLRGWGAEVDCACTSASGLPTKHPASTRNSALFCKVVRGGAVSGTDTTAAVSSNSGGLQRHCSADWNSVIIQAGQACQNRVGSEVATLPKLPKLLAPSGDLSEHCSKRSCRIWLCASAAVLSRLLLLLDAWAAAHRHARPKRHPYCSSSCFTSVSCFTDMSAAIETE
eukprot:6460901-Amphidinium_carterae.2